jgi:hypothetical protein
MKTKHIVIILLLMLFSCKQAECSVDGNNFLFQYPQPINDSELSKIPNKFHGIYLNSDSIYLNINDNYIIKENYNRFKIHKTALDSLKNEFDVVNGQYIAKNSKEIYTPKILGDSIELTFKNIDTIFAFSNNKKAKRVNGQIIISKKDAAFWNIKMISLERNNLKIKEIISNEDLIRMDSITKIKSKMIDSTSFIIAPTRPEFVEFLNLKHFGFEQGFKKIK